MNELIRAIEVWRVANPLPAALIAALVPLIVGLLVYAMARSRRVPVEDTAAAPVPRPRAELESVAVPESIAVPEFVARTEAIDLAARLRRTRDHLVGRIGRLVSGRVVDAELLDELEEVLLSADLGVRTADSLLSQVKKQTQGADAAQVRGVLREAILEKLRTVESTGVFELRGSPHVILVLAPLQSRQYSESGLCRIR